MRLVANLLQRQARFTSLNVISKGLHSCSVLRRRFDIESISNRTMDKTHRLMYQKLEKRRTRYKKRKIDLHANIRFLLIQVEKYREGSLEDVEIINHNTSRSKANEMLEPVVFYFATSLLHIKNYSRLSDSSAERMSHNIQKHLESIAERIRFLQQRDNATTDDMIRENEVKLETDMEKVKESFLSTSSVPSSVDLNLKLALVCFQEISKMAYDNIYDVENDLVAWVLSIFSPNVTRSCSSLSGHTNIPVFILSDVLLRTPISKLEYHLQLDIWDTYLKGIAVYYYSKITYLKDVIGNLAFYGIHFQPRKLPDFFDGVCSFFTSTRFGYQFVFFDKEFCNDLIWKLIYDTMEIQALNSRSIISEVVKSQEVIINHLSKIEPVEERTHKKLNLSGYMGIVAAITHIDVARAKRYLEMAEKKFIYGSLPCKRKDLTKYHATRVLVTSTPEELLHNFNASAVDFSGSATLWSAFISKLLSFGLLNEKRALKILDELIKSKDSVLIKKDMVRMLTSPINSINGIETFIKKMQNASSVLLHKHSNTLISAYLIVLYKNLNSDYSSETYLPWDKVITSHPADSHGSRGGFKNYPSIIEYARFLYTSCIPKKTASIVGIMLNGEARLQPENIYHMYKSELADHHLSPDQFCLNALVRAATVKVKESNSSLMWGDMYAPQLAIHEFKKNVVSASKIEESFAGCDIYPQDSLWRNYIMMLAKFSYTSELASIIQWWEGIDFCPSSETLCSLLASLPPPYSQRYIQHIEKLNHDSLHLLGSDSSISASPNSYKWPWPSLEQLELFCKYFPYKNT